MKSIRTPVLFMVFGLLLPAKGKVVMGGADPFTFETMGYKFNPVINLKPDVKFIYDQCTSLIERRKDFLDMGNKSRSFVEKYHNYKNIASEYIDFWQRS